MSEVHLYASAMMRAAMSIALASDACPRHTRLRALGETPGYEPLERQQVTSPCRDNRLRALGETTGYEPLERQQVTSPWRDNRLRAIGETSSTSSSASRAGPS